MCFGKGSTSTIHQEQPPPNYGFAATATVTQSRVQTSTAEDQANEDRGSKRKKDKKEKKSKKNKKGVLLKEDSLKALEPKEILLELKWMVKEGYVTEFADGILEIN